VPSDLLKNGRVMPNWRLGVAASLASDFRSNGFLFPGGHIFRQLKRLRIWVALLACVFLA
jgi:hypothetical protein